MASSTSTLLYQLAHAAQLGEFDQLERNGDGVIDREEYSLGSQQGNRSEGHLQGATASRSNPARDPESDEEEQVVQQLMTRVQRMEAKVRGVKCQVRGPKAADGSSTSRPEAAATAPAPTLGSPKSTPGTSTAATAVQPSRQMPQHLSPSIPDARGRKPQSAGLARIVQLEEQEQQRSLTQADMELQLSSLGRQLQAQQDVIMEQQAIQDVIEGQGAILEIVSDLEQQVATLEAKLTDKQSWLWDAENVMFCLAGELEKERAAAALLQSSESESLSALKQARQEVERLNRLVEGLNLRLEAEGMQEQASKSSAMRQLRCIVARMLKGQLGMWVTVWKRALMVDRAMQRVAAAVADTALVAACKDKEDHLRRLGLVLDRSTRLQLSMRLTFWRRASHIEQLASLEQIQQLWDRQLRVIRAMDCLQHAINGLAKGHTGLFIALIEWRAQMKDALMMRHQQGVLKARSNALKQLQQIVARIVQGVVSLCVLVWRIRSKERQELMQQAALSAAMQQARQLSSVKQLRHFLARAAKADLGERLHVWRSSLSEVMSSHTSVAESDAFQAIVYWLSRQPASTDNDGVIAEWFRDRPSGAIEWLCEQSPPLKAAKRAEGPGMEPARSKGGLGLESIEEYEQALVASLAVVEPLQSESRRQREEIQTLEAELAALGQATQEVQEGYSAQVQKLQEQILELTNQFSESVLISKAKAVHSAGRHHRSKSETQQLASSVSVWRARMHGAKASVMSTIQRHYMTVQTIRVVWVWKAAMVQECFTSISHLVPVLQDQLQASEQHRKRLDAQLGVEPGKQEPEPDATGSSTLLSKPNGAYSKLEAENRFLKGQLTRANNQLAATILDNAVEGALQKQAAEVAEAQRLLQDGQSRLDAEKAQLLAELDSAGVDEPGTLVQTVHSPEDVKPLARLQQRSATASEVVEWSKPQPLSSAAEDAMNTARAASPKAGSPFASSRARIAQQRSARPISSNAFGSRKKAKDDRVQLELEALRNMGRS